MVSVIPALLWLLWVMVAPTEAARYWVSPTGSDANACASVDGDDDPGVYKATPSGGRACLAAGDTLTIKAGTYTGSTATLSAVPAGPSLSAHTIVEGDPSDATGCALTSTCSVILQPSSGVSTTITASNITFRKMKIDHINSKTKYPLEIVNSVGASHILIEDMEFTGTQDSTTVSPGPVGGIIQTPMVSFVTYRRIHVHDTGNTATHNGHGMYIQGDDTTVEHSVVYNNANSGIQCFNGHTTSDGRPDRCTITTSVFRDNYSAGVIVEGHDSVVRNNLIYSNGAGFIAGYSGANRLHLYNNVITNNSGTGVSLRSGTTDSQVINNVLTANTGVEYENTSGSTGIILSNNACTASETCGTTGKLTITALTDILVSAADLRLKAGSAAINAGTAVSGPVCNGTCDIGAFEAVPTPTVSITTNTMTLIFPLNGNVPISVATSAGVSVACTGHASCPGSPTISSVTRVVGTDTQVSVVVSGITGNACASTQTWTVSYTPGVWTDSAEIGGTLHQPIFAFANIVATNQCTGSGPPGGTPSHIAYPMEDGSGTTVSDTSGNALHGTTSGTWVSGKTGYGINVASGTTQQTAIPYGNGVNPSTQSMTWVVPVYIPTGQTSITRYLFGPEIGTNQRGYIGAQSGTWRVARQSTSISAAGASNLAVVEGWNYLCGTWNATTDTVTLTNNGVTGTGGATGSYTSYTFATNFEFPMIGTNLHQTVPEATFDDVQVFTSLQDCAALYSAWNAPPPAAAGTLAQAAIQFQGVILDTAGSPIVVGPSVQSIEVPAGGGAAILFQVHCTNVSDCALTSFKLVYAKNGGSTWQQVPDTQTADGTWMWGVTTEANLNNGTRSTRLTGSCTVTTGATQVTSAQTPSIDLPQDGCIVLAYLVRVTGTAGVDYFDYKLRTEGNVDFTTYDQTARLRIVNPMASGIGF